ncbi:unnamed protein product [Rotaria magnacalcarata]
MQTLAQISSIYVYCFDKEANLRWSQPYSKVKAVCTELQQFKSIKRIETEASTTNDSSLGASYNIIGIVYRYLGHYVLALYHYNLSLKVKLKSLLAQHPDIAMAYENTGLVYEDKVELEIGIDIYEEGSDNL